jgi:pachytene checkpoint protein 2
MRPTSERRLSDTASRTTRPAALPTGVSDIRPLPDSEFLELWNSILGVTGIQHRLLAQAVLNFTVRPRVSRSILPLHGVILITGVPGTGKTSLARGLSARVAEVFHGRHELGAFRFVEVDPHAVASAALGKTQRAVTELFGSTIAEQAALGPTIVLLDEVETLVADRAKLSLEANPVDVHRATDAVLVQLDQLAAQHENLLFVATSNFPQAVDTAFVSRADWVVTVPPPDEGGRLAILQDTLSGMAVVFPTLGLLSRSPELTRVAREADGLDGRAIRKLVAAACAVDKDTAIDPGRLTIAQLLTVAREMRAQRPAAPARLP